MKISFDLDDTLIPAKDEDFETEGKNLIQKLLGIESIRKGTKGVFEELKNSRHEVGVYTTSYRGIGRIRFQFWTYGISTDFIVNEKLNRKRLKEIGKSSSKYPPAFDVNLHIDDSNGVEMEGEKHGFNVIILTKDESDWTNKIIENV
ncbi:MAG: hypothetical protein ACI8XB_001192 [Patiriisocius sp.]|jgi:hypothetical protein